MDEIERRLGVLGFQLPNLREPIGVYHGGARSGNLLFLSGHGPIKDGNRVFLGKLGQELDIEQGREAARIAVLNALRTVKEYVGDLDAVARVVKLLCFVNSAAGFRDQPAVMDAASQLLVDAFGDRGWHARTAVGMYELPFNISVELEMVVEVGD